MKTIKAKVHRLPTNEASNGTKLITRSPLHKILKYGEVVQSEKVGNYPCFHLYITTDEEIKEGDWVLIDWRTIDAIDIEECESEERAKMLNERETTKKIIATTDPEFIADGVAEIEQSFIEDYCKAGGIDEVLVEYTPCDTCNVIDVACGRVDCRATRNGYPKLNQNNEIIIHPVEEKMYNLTYKQLWSLFTHAQSWGYEHAMKDHVWQWKENEKGNQSIPKELNKWIEENL